MNVAEVADKLGLSPHTIRYYDKLGLLPSVQRSKSGARQFTASDVAFLQFLLGLKKTGMSLDEIAEFTADGCIDVYTMSPREAAKAVRLLNVKEVVPTHFGGFDFLTGRPDELRALTHDLGVTVYDLEPGQALVL